MQELPLLALRKVVPGDLWRRCRAQVFLPERRHAAVVRQHVWQRMRRAAAGEVGDRPADLRIARQRAVGFLDIPGLEVRPLRERERHRAVACGTAPEFELAVHTAEPQHRVLAEACDEAEAFVRRRQRSGKLARFLQEARCRLGTFRPLVRIEGIEVLAEIRRGQEVAQPGESRQHLAREFVGTVLEIQHRDAADQRVGAAQRLHRDEHALVRRAELNHAADALAALVRERSARDEAACAVANEDDVLALFAQQAVGELTAVPQDVAAPVVGMEDGIEAGNPEHEPQPLVGEPQDADRPVAIAGGERELHQLALCDLDRIEPGDVGAAVLAQEPDARAHDAGQDQEARAAPHARGTPRQAR